MRYNPAIKEGVIEIFCGPMKGEKTKNLLRRVRPLRYMNPSELLAIKPKRDTRDDKIKARDSSEELDCLLVDEKRPRDILKFVEPQHRVIAMDEVELFYKGIEDVVEYLSKMGKNIVLAGLDKNFRGEAFGRMANLLILADQIEKSTAVCEFINKKFPGRENHIRCTNPATRTQKLIHGSPAPYLSDEVSIEGEEKSVTYEARCIEHHFVPGKRRYLNLNDIK